MLSHYVLIVLLQCVNFFWSAYPSRAPTQLSLSLGGISLQLKLSIIIILSYYANTAHNWETRWIVRLSCSHSSRSSPSVLPLCAPPLGGWFFPEPAEVGDDRVSEAVDSWVSPGGCLRVRGRLWRPPQPLTPCCWLYSNTCNNIWFSPLVWFGIISVSWCSYM